jgi:hypothetical protein
MNDWQEYEKLAARIYSELEPHAHVSHNDRIKGADTGRKRQVDVSIRATVAGIDLLIVVQAKNYARPANINAIDAFASVVRDVRAAKGILICNAGFTKPAKDYARNIGIDLCSLHDAQSRNWSLDIKLPLLWIDLLPSVNLEFQCFLEAGDSIPYDPRQWVLSADGGKTRLLPLQTFERKWNARELDRRCGMIHNLVSEQKDIKVLVDKGVWRPVESLILRYVVHRRAWLGYFRPSECRGILNRIKDEFTVSYFNIGDIPMVRDESWVPVEDPEKLVITTKGTLVTTERWEISVNDAEFNFAVKKIA